MKKIITILLMAAMLFACFTLASCNFSGIIDDIIDKIDETDGPDDGGDTDPTAAPGPDKTDAPSGHRYAVRLPEKITYKMETRDDGELTNDILVVKIGDEYYTKSVTSDAEYFFRKKDNGNYDMWMMMGEEWYYLSSEMVWEGLIMNLGFFVIGDLDFDAFTKTGTDSVNGIPVDIYKDSYGLFEYALHETADEMYIVSSKYSNVVAAMTDLSTSDVAFPVEVPAAQ